MPSRAGGVVTKVRTNVDAWSLPLGLLDFGSLKEIGKPWFPTNNAWHTALCSPASVADGCAGHPGCHAPPEGCMNRPISHRLPDVLKPLVYLVFIWHASRMDVVERGCPIATIAHYTVGTDKCDPWTWSGTDPHKALISQLWCRGGRQLITVYNESDWWIWNLNFLPFQWQTHSIIADETVRSKARSSPPAYDWAHWKTADPDE